MSIKNREIINLTPARDMTNVVECRINARPFESGKGAYLLGIERSGNPNNTSPNRESWEKGWTEAKNTFEINNRPKFRKEF